mmetsp:Transcript_18982/g.28352  ORF Transcript_18982/g.28352 Transcript_18982/m.28352 type:complete len:97 (-) Transcript_18982:237-527(-)
MRRPNHPPPHQLSCHSTLHSTADQYIQCLGTEAEPAFLSLLALLLYQSVGPLLSKSNVPPFVRSQAVRWFNFRENVICYEKTVPFLHIGHADFTIR